ncbi:hypothetical protein D3C85_1929190 [compost metagenome]
MPLVFLINAERNGAGEMVDYFASACGIQIALIGFPFRIGCNVGQPCIGFASAELVD